MEPQHIVANVRSIFSLPEAVMKINALINSGEASNSELEQAVLNDPALTAKILKFSNSAYFGFSRKVDTISHAIALIGHSELRNLTLVSMVVSAFKGVSADTFNMKSFWHHNVSTGIIARLLACDIDSRERMFIAGLLHAIGKLILLSQFPDKAVTVLNIKSRDEKDRIEAERQVFGFTSTQLSAEFLNAWELPESIWRIVAAQHEPLQERQFKTDACTLYLSTKIATYKQQHPEEPLNGSEIAALCDPAVWDYLGLTDEVIELVNTVADLQIIEMYHYINPEE